MSNNHILIWGSGCRGQWQWRHICRCYETITLRQINHQELLKNFRWQNVSTIKMFLKKSILFNDVQERRLSLHGSW